MTIATRQRGPRLLTTLPHQHFASVLAIAPFTVKGFFFGVLVAGFISHQATATDDAAQSTTLSQTNHEDAFFAATVPPQFVVAHHPGRADFKLEKASQEAKYVADWVVDSGDNRSMPFVIIDKTDAKVFIFNADGRLRGAARALLGMAHGDDTVPGIGDRAMSKIRPEERTTPAGRFVAALGRNLRGEDILWVDYDASIAMHRVVTTNPKERRLQRLATATAFDKRISYGCINVPAKFYDKVVHPAFTGTNGVVYVLPEIKPVSEVFLSYDVDEQARTISASQPAINRAKPIPQRFP